MFGGGGGGDNIGQIHGGHTNDGGGGGHRGLGRPWALVWPMKRILLSAKTKAIMFVTPFGAILFLNDICPHKEEIVRNLVD